MNFFNDIFGNDDDIYSDEFKDYLENRDQLHNRNYESKNDTQNRVSDGNTCMHYNAMGVCTPTREGIMTQNAANGARPLMQKIQSLRESRQSNYVQIHQDEPRQLEYDHNHQQVIETMRQLPNNGAKLIGTSQTEIGRRLSGVEFEFVDFVYDKPHQVTVNASANGFHVENIEPSVIRVSRR